MLSGYAYIQSSTHILVHSDPSSPPDVLEYATTKAAIQSGGYHSEDAASGVWPPHVLSVAETPGASSKFQYPEEGKAWLCKTCTRHREVTPAHHPPPVSSCE